MVKKEYKLKAKLENFDLVKEKVKKIATYKGKEDVIDFFYIWEKTKEQWEFRIRKLKNKKTITFKIPISTYPVQENEEYEFNVDKAEDFVKFIDILGFRSLSGLRKKCEIYQKKNIAIRLSKIENLGDYIELTAECKKDFTQKKERELIDLLKALGIKTEAIDNRYYGAIKDKMDKLAGGEDED